MQRAIIEGAAARRSLERDLVAGKERKDFSNFNFLRHHNLTERIFWMVNSLAMAVVEGGFVVLTGRPLVGGEAAFK